jgi:hypothetical protein
MASKQKTAKFCLCARECRKIPTIPAEIRTTPYAMCSLLSVGRRATLSSNRLAMVALLAVGFGLKPRARDQDVPAATRAARQVQSD